KSISVTSGRWAAKARSASAPLDACAANTISGALLTTAAIPSRNSGWSSTLSTRIRASPIRPFWHERAMLVLEEEINERLNAHAIGDLAFQNDHSCVDPASE